MSGASIGMFDVASISHPPTPRAKIARFCHFAVPITASFVSYVAARDFLGIVSEKTGGRNDAYWTFFGAMSAPGAIIGSWCEYFMMHLGLFCASLHPFFFSPPSLLPNSYPGFRSPLGLLRWAALSWVQVRLRL